MPLSTCLLFLCIYLMTGSFTPVLSFQDSDKWQITLNGMGWMFKSRDSITQAFLKSCENNPEASVLEIGAAYGYASHQAVLYGARVTVNDLDSKHLENFLQELPLSKRSRVQIASGDFITLPNLISESYDSILAVRVLHFFSPQKLRQSIKKMYDLLKPGGCVYILADTPYLKTWAAFIPVYEDRLKQGDPFPGYIQNPQAYLPAALFNLPSEVHFLNPLVLKREFEAAGYMIETCGYLSRPDYPESLRWDGRESVGLIARKK